MARDEETTTEMHEHHEVVIAGDTDLVEKVIGIDTDVRMRQKKSKEEKRLVRRMDMLLLPLLSGSIFFAYLVSWPQYPYFRLVSIILRDGH